MANPGFRPFTDDELHQLTIGEIMARLGEGGVDLFHFGFAATTTAGDVVPGGLLFTIGETAGTLRERVQEELRAVPQARFEYEPSDLGARVEKVCRIIRDITQNVTDAMCLATAVALELAAEGGLSAHQVAVGIIEATGERGAS